MFRNSLHRCRGSAAVEFALALPLLVLFWMSVADLLYVGFSAAAFQAAARRAVGRALGDGAVTPAELAGRLRALDAAAEVRVRPIHRRARVGRPDRIVSVVEVTARRAAQGISARLATAFRTAPLQLVAHVREIYVATD